jgi:hypothetical protein
MPNNVKEPYSLLLPSPIPAGVYPCEDRGLTSLWVLLNKSFTFKLIDPHPRPLSHKWERGEVCASPPDPSPLANAILHQRLRHMARGDKVASGFAVYSLIVEKEIGLEGLQKFNFALAA